MKLGELLEENAVTSLPDCEITGLTDDSRRVKPGMLFACLRGEHFDGHSVAKDMLDAGAAAVLVDHDLGLGDRQIITPDTRALYGKLCAAWFGHPERKMRFVGVTGTNGKTTITYVLRHIFQQRGYKVGLIGTIQNAIGDTLLHTENTTPFVYDLMALYAEMAEAGCDIVIMEVSSFGLAQERIGDTFFETAIFTNLTQDHLDYHRDMEDYYQAKKLLFSRCNTAVISVDDPYGKRLQREISCPRVTYGCTGGCDFSATDIVLRSDGATFSLTHNQEEIPVSMHLCGRFNVSNALAAIAAAGASGFSWKDAVAALETFPGVPGRCEVIPTGKGFTLIRDYAHTPDAIENILQSVKEITKGRLICLFGCGGNRDAAKRPLMLQAAGKYADFIMITSDNPRNENPEAIIADILTGISAIDPPVPYEVVVDRREAILRTMQLAEEDDVIVLAGKGHEDYQILAGNRKIHMDEREIVEEFLPRIPDKRKG